MAEPEQDQNEISIGQIISKYKSAYSRFTPVFSSAIGEEIYFSMAGFKHLIFKGQHRRQNKVIYSRMVLVPLIKPVIKNCQEVVEIREVVENLKGKKTQVTYYALEARVGKSSARVRVVVKRVGKKGKCYFQSVMKYN